jgi:amidase
MIQMVSERHEAEIDATVRAFIPGPRLLVAPTGKGPLDGLTCAIKDVFDIAGHVTGFGNPTWLATHGPARTHAQAVRALLRNGARIIGKTVTDELAFSLNGSNHHYGAPLNSAAPERLTGGSSCGSAAAVAAGFCDFALGTDTAGSIRAPGSFCGLYGFRPTHGAISTKGVCALAPGFDTVGWLARDLEVLQAVGSVLLPKDGHLLEGSTVGWAMDCWDLIGVDAAARTCGMFARFSEKEMTPSVVEIVPSGLEGWMQAFRTLQFAEVWAELGPWIGRHRPALGPGIAERLQAASRVTAIEVEAASEVRRHVQGRLDQIWATCKALVIPTVADIAPKRDASTAFLESFRLDAIRLLCIAGLGGCPQITMPWLTKGGAPMGVSLIAPRGADRQLLALAARIAHRFRPQVPFGID